MTNTGPSQVTDSLSTRALTESVSDQSGSFCLNPSDSSTGNCGAPTANTFTSWGGTTEAYQEETFTYPSTTNPSRLILSTTYPYDNPPQSSILHVALLEPDGSYAGHPIPQGLERARLGRGDKPTRRDMDGHLLHRPGQERGQRHQWHDPLGREHASVRRRGVDRPVDPDDCSWRHEERQLTVTSPHTSGDKPQSLVLSASGSQTTIPVTVRRRCRSAPRAEPSAES